MITEQSARKIEDILKRLHALETRTYIHYDKGTYAPTYLGATTAGVTTYTTQAGFWKRLGPVIFFDGRVVWTAATGTGVAEISLPFTTDPTTNMRYGVMQRTNAITFANGSIECNIQPGVAFFTMESPITNAATTAINVEAAGDIIFSGFFFVA